MSEKVNETSDLAQQGAEYLTLLGYEDRIDVPVTVGEVTVTGKDFLQFCGEHAIPVFTAFKELTPGSPEYIAARKGLISMVEIFMTPSEVNK